MKNITLDVFFSLFHEINFFVDKIMQLIVNKQTVVGIY